MTPDQRDYWVTVCAECMRASCWHDEHPCKRSAIGDIVDYKASELRTLGYEHEDNFSVVKLSRVCGGVKFVDPIEEKP